MTPKQDWLNHPLARREAFARVAQAALGVSLLSSASRQVEAAASNGTPVENVIFLFMQGAMSHIDTFDPKPGREEQG